MPKKTAQMSALRLTLLFFLLILLNQEAQAASIDLRDPINNQTKEFIILTNGDYLKLYPLSREGDDPREVHSDAYEIKPAELKWIDQTGWALARDDKKFVTSKRPSIVPARYGSDLNHQEKEGTGYRTMKPSLPNASVRPVTRQPIISRVDYFYDARFCDHSRSEQPGCLVIFWLDSSNKLIRMGSLDLVEHSIAPYNTQTTGQANILTLREYKPISLCELLQSADHVETINNECVAYSMVLDKATKTIHATVGRAKSDVYLWHAKIEVIPEQTDTKLVNGGSRQLAWGGKRSLSISVGSLHTTLYSLNEGGDEINIYLNGSVSSVSIGDSIDPKTSKPLITGKRAKLLTIDPLNGRIYWLSGDNELYSRDSIVESWQLVGKLAPRRLFGLFNRMQMFAGNLYISDQRLKTLSVYKLPTSANYNATSNIQTPKVLLVEHPTLRDFQVVSVGQSVIDIRHLLGLDDRKSRQNEVPATIVPKFTRSKPAETAMMNEPDPPRDDRPEEEPEQYEEYYGRLVLVLAELVVIQFSLIAFWAYSWWKCREGGRPGSQQDKLLGSKSLA